MHRILLQFSFFTIYSWGLAIAIGFGVAILYFLSALKKEHIPPGFIMNLLVGIVLFAILGGRVFHVLINLHYYVFRPGGIIRLWEGGMVLYGGLIFSLAFSIYYIRRYNLPFGKIADSATPAIAFGLTIGRVGCFLNGCCYGVPSGFGFVFPPTSPAGLMFPGQTLFPTQLISSLNLLIMGLILHLFRKRDINRHKLLPLFLIFYSIHRFFIEFVRGDTFPFFLNLTLFQIISIILIIFSLVWWKTGFKFYSSP